MDDSGDITIHPGWEHTTVTLDNGAFTLEAFIDALEAGTLENYVRSLPRQDLSTSSDEAVAKFREAAKVYLFR
jgi:hypothetical protein